MVFKKKFIRAVIFLFLFYFVPNIYAENYLYFSNAVTQLEIYENFQVREKYRETIFSSLHHSRNAKERVCNQEDYTHSVKFKTVQKNNALFFLFLNKRRGEFPMIGRGNVSIKRSLENSEILNMTMLIRDHNGCYIRLKPNNERTSLDLFLFGTRIYHHVLIPLPFHDLIFEPFTKIVDLTSTIIGWDLILYKGYNGAYTQGIEVFEKIRTVLPQLRTVQDGAQSKSGDYVFIRDESTQPEPGGFNCSGFAKWIIDGFYYPLKGEYTTIGALKEKHLEYRGNRWSQWYEDERDPYFGLDWTRNLAVTLNKARNNRKNVNPESFDIRDIQYLEYVEDVGYTMNDLELVLFLCAVKNQDCFYLGSVNQTIDTLHQHFHIAVFFPYFTHAGRFKVIVMEKNKETGLPVFCKDYKNNYIHLVKISSKGEFIIPLLQ